jgi:translation initiation factor 1 (eIF-1/SUI1)
MYRNKCSIFFAALTSLSSLSFAQTDDQLCQIGLKPAIEKMTLHWDNFNRYGNEQSKDIESQYKMAGQGDKCRIQSQKVNGEKVNRLCTWTNRMSCELKMGAEPASHKFSTGASVHEGTLAWTGNDKIRVNVKQGDATNTIMRDVAVVKFKGMWKNNSGTGTSSATVYYDRDWGILLKAEGWNGGNQWGNTITLVDLMP